MTRYLSNLVKFLVAVFWESWQKTFTLFSILGIVIFFFPSVSEKLIEDEVLARTIGGLIFFFSFLFANYSIYLRSVNDKADIRLKAAGQSFTLSSSGRSPFREIQSNPYGFSKQGLPDWATLYAEIEIANIGCEEGQLYWELYLSKTKLPPLFGLEKYKLDFQPPLHIAGRQPSRALLFFDVLLSEHSPQTFAVALKKLIQSKKKYRLVMKYWTKSVDGESNHRELKITGNFIEFYKQVLQHWDDFGFADLARIGRMAEV